MIGQHFTLYCCFTYFKGGTAIRTQALYRMNTDTRCYEIWIPKNICKIQLKASSVLSIQVKRYSRLIEAKKMYGSEVYIIMYIVTKYEYIYIVLAFFIA